MSTKQSNPRRFMTDMVAHAKRMCHKENKPFDLDLDFLCALWNRQSGRCALTGVELSHTRNSLYSVRIDSIDRKLGYTKKNTQLICDGVKRMKKDMSNESVKEFLQEVKSIMIY